ncbi:uncharacterized protein LOC135479278 [Liolophura sinensis]|uniref:uncharacterized protein LOC135479278 n=1 Tax=Liolophura sinensis TaxID=3198878 RepID=UPI0031582D19
MGKGRQEEEKRPNGTADDSEEPNLPVPPDGGWGWMVVFSSFLIHVVADGIVYSFGIFYVEFLDFFKGGKGETAWVGSLVPGITLSVGPIASALTNKYGCRPVTIAGALIASTGFILSLFAPNIYYLYFSFGVLSGLGFGLIYLPAIVIVTNYFEKRRAFATGLAVCGSGCGTFIFAPLSKWLLDQFGWKGAILIQAGIILNCVALGALFRPLEESVPRRKHNHLDDEEVEALVKHSEHSGNPIVKFKKHQNRNAQKKGDTHLSPIFNVQPNMIRSDGALHVIGNGKSTPGKSVGSMSPPSPRHLHPLVSEKRHSSHVTLRTPVSVRGPMYRKDIFYSGSLVNIPMYRSNPAMYVTSITSIPEHISSAEDWKLFGFIKLSPEMRDTLKQMLDFSLLKDPVFLLFAISNLCTSIGFNMPFIYLPDRALELGIDSTDAAFLISVIGIANTFGRIVFGWLSDRQSVNRLHLYNCALTICGLWTALSPLCTTYPWLIAYAASFGLFIGVYVSLTSVVLVDLLGLEKLTNSFGLLLLFQGVATLIGPPIAGWIYDGTGSYDISFIAEGTMIALSGVMLWWIPCLQRRRNRSTAGTDLEVDFGKECDIKVKVDDVSA